MPSLLLFLLLCIGAQSAGAAGLRVIATIKPIHSILAGLMQGAEQPALIVEGTATPFDYRLSERKARAIREADLVVWIGPELETFMTETLARSPKDLRIVTLLDSPAIKVLPLRDNDQERDPFLWLDSRNVVILVDELARILMEVDPVRTHLYERNRRRVLAIISRIDREFEYGYRGMKGGVGLLYHDTQQYFEQAYALKIGAVLSQTGIDRISTESLLKARAAIRDGEFACLLVEKGLPSGSLPLLTEGAMVEIAALDSFGGNFSAGPDLYEKVMRHNTEVIKTCMLRAGNGPEETAGPVPPEIGEGSMRGRFMLIDQYGDMVTQDLFRDRFNLVYFGYTQCPDICPNSLQVMSAALNRLGASAMQIQPLFITVDPERDKPNVVREYVGYFGPRLVGLTGTPSMIERVTRQYNVRYEKVIDDKSEPGMYLMDHTASLFLIGPDGRFVTKFAYGISPDQLIEKLREHIPALSHSS